MTGRAHCCFVIARILEGRQFYLFLNFGSEVPADAHRIVTMEIISPKSRFAVAGGTGAAVAGEAACVSVVATDNTVIKKSGAGLAEMIIEWQFAYCFV